jgi:type III secretory pathway lipoprotein EscJ
MIKRIFSSILMLFIGSCVGYELTKLTYEDNQDKIMAVLVNSNIELTKAKTELKTLEENGLIKTQEEIQQLSNSYPLIDIPSFPIEDYDS